MPIGSRPDPGGPQLAQRTTYPTRFDPSTNSTVRIRWGVACAAGVSQVTALEPPTEVIACRQGGDAGSVRTMSGRYQFEPITLERGITHDHEPERRPGSARADRAPRTRPTARSHDPRCCTNNQEPEMPDVRQTA